MALMIGWEFDGVVANALVLQALDEDAETMVRKVWRMLVFYSESEKRGGLS